MPEPLDYDYVDYLIDSDMEFYAYEDYDEDNDVTRTIAAASGLRRTPDAGYVRLMWEINNDLWGFPEGDIIETKPTIWWQAGDREEFDSYPYEFGQIPLVADRVSA